LGSAGTMEKTWRDADVHEVTSREGNRGNASMEMFFSDFRTFTKDSAIETDSRLTRMERVNRVSPLHIFCSLVALRGAGRLQCGCLGLRSCFNLTASCCSR
jgi:hypothetical protein